ncbi:hypothetical protein HPB52_011330 [Rhipicephalus sanguineus]|uniref:Nlr family card domain protein n=1 Tax=Rhipicephalus sanguineus TaxID=34632 RepID=A0A9D4PK42_RHISA|nr:hypothetical protein HPB52_011330 [Rhipicephalus sanguineus]
MATFGGADKDPQVPRFAKNVSDLLVDLEGAGGFFSGKVLDYRMACTAAADRTCQIVVNLSVWNEFLLWINLELRESPQPERQLRLERIYHKLDWLDRTDREKEQRQATTALFWLLKTHRCVARICIPSEVYDRCFPILREAFYGNSSLKSLTLEASLNSKLWKVIASMKGLEELECSGTKNARPRSISALLQSTQTLTVLKFSETYGIENSLSQRFLAALKANKTLRVLSINSDAIAGDPDLFAEIMGDSNTLQDVTVISAHSSRPSDMKWVLRVDVWWRALSMSLRLNRSIVKLGVGVGSDGGDNVRHLGEAVSRSPTIRKFHLLSFDKIELAAFLRGLRTEIFDNYALCSAVFETKPILMDLAAYWFEVSDTARRNYGLVVRAAHFLKDLRSDRLCAAALERVSRHPALVAELAEVLRIGETEAANAVRQRFQEMQGLHDFMRLAGVVRDRVRCEDDGSTQLDALDSRCWLHVRRYLRLDDVACDLAEPPSSP